MTPAETPDKLKEFCIELEKRDGIGILVSGGSNKDGTVELRPFLGVLNWIKENTDLIVNIHTGLLNKEAADEIRATGIDVVSVDVVGHNDTIKEVYGLKADVEDYLNTLHTLKETGIKHVIPHVCLGLHFGEILGEYRALEIACSIDPEVLVILGLIPTKNTAMELIDPLPIMEIINIINFTRINYPKVDISLGCMRTRQEKEKLEWLALDAGVNRISTPSNSTIRKARQKGYEIKVLDGCCAIPKNLEGKAVRV
jgi:uncharacterized radical SAM superfamily protein